MKLVFFVIACLLIGIRIYFSWSGRVDKASNRANIVIKSPDFEERISWLGQIHLNDSETAVISISPGGYLKYFRNDTSFVAESNLKGVISYNFSSPANLGDVQKEMIAKQAVQEMIHYGFNAEARMDDIFRKGGYPALIAELGKTKLDNLQQMYVDRILSADSLSYHDLFSMMSVIKNFGSDETKARLLQKISPRQLDSADVSEAYFLVIESFNSDDEKKRAMEHLIDNDSLSQSTVDAIIRAAPHINNNMDRANLYQHLAEKKPMADEQWILIFSQLDSLNDDNQKSNLLVALSQKIPQSETLKAAYIHAAKSITSDNDYGRAMRAINGK